MTTGLSDNVHAKHNVVRGKQMFNIERLKVMTIKFTKDKETKTKVRYTATGDVSGSIYIEKDSELAKDSEIILEISQVTA
tara:strand:- start:9 stop:248 length:240 start_codon:yes stop_codon:yes gene_type:complete